MLALLLFGLALVSCYVYVTRPDRLAALADNLLTAMTGADVRIHSARFDFDGTIELGRVELHVPGLDADAARLFDAAEVSIKHDLFSLLRGQFHPQSLTFINPRLHLTELTASGKFNYEYLQREEDNRGGDLPEQLPEVYLRGGQVIFSELDGRQFTPLGNLRLSGTLTETPEKDKTYFFKLRQDSGPNADGPTLSGQFDLRKLAITGRLERFVLEGPQRNILPRRLRAWWDTLEPSGSFPTVAFGYDPDPAIGLHVLFQVHDVELSLPYVEDRARMVVTSGQFTIANETINVRNLTGVIEGFRYTINGQVQGFDAEAPVQLTAQIEGVVPDKPRFLPWLPQNVQRTFNRYTPAGNFKATVMLERHVHGGAFDYDGRVQVLNATLVAARFPYRLEGVGGEFRFDRNQLQIVSLHGEGLSGAQVVVRGTITPPGDDAAVDLTVDAVNVPLDEFLLQALEPRERVIVRQLLDHDSYAALTDVDHGLIQSRDQQAQWSQTLGVLQLQLKKIQSVARLDIEALDNCRAQIADLQAKLARPTFDMGGTVIAHARVVRPPGPKQQINITTRVELGGCGMLMRAWPHPLKITRGSVTIDSTAITIHEAQLATVDGGIGKVTGGYFPGTDLRHRFSPQIRFAAIELPLNDLLIRSLRPEQAQWIERLQLTGALDAAGEIFRRPDGELDFLINVKLNRGTARPFGGEYLFDDLSAELTLNHDQVKIDSSLAKRGESTVAVRGLVDWGKAGVSYDLRIAGRQLNLSDPLGDLLPDEQHARQVRQWMDAYQPNGKFDLDLTYRHDPQRDPTHPPQLDLQLRPHRLDVLVRGQRVAMNEITADLRVQPEKVLINQWRSTLGEHGHVEGSGFIAMGKQPQARLNFSAASQSINPVVRALLPTEVTSAIDVLELASAFEITGATLEIDNAAGGGEIHFDGQVKLAGASASVGVPIRDIDALLKVRVDQQPGAPRPHIDIHVRAPRLRAADRLVTAVEFRVHNQETAQRLLIDGLLAEMYGGMIVGEGRVAPGGRYQVRLTAQNVALQPFLHPLDGQISESAGGGLLAAELAISGWTGLGELREGRGQFEVRDARMYQVPLMLSILHLVNLSLPGATSFDRAAANFLINGDTIAFESIRFESPSLEVAGAGTMDYQTRELDLDMAISNPAAVNLGPISSVLKVVKNELLLIHVGGTLDKPQAKARSLQGIRRSWEHLFGSTKNGAEKTSPLTPPMSYGGTEAERSGYSVELPEAHTGEAGASSEGQ